jgi:hypothetical protein
MPNELKNTIKLNVLKFLNEDKELEDIQADLRSNDEDIEAALSKWGLSGKLGYTPLSSMVEPFEASFKIKFGGGKIPVSWKGVNVDVEGDSEVLNFTALLWLDPKAKDNAVNGKPQDTYKFKVVKLDDGSGLKDVKDNIIEFDGKQINVEDKRMKQGKESPTIPQLRTGRKYFIKWYSELTSEGGGDTDDDGGEVNVPEEVASGKNRNEIFRQLVNIYGGYKGAPVYGDGFLKAEESREYNKLQSASRKGKVDKSKVKEFRDGASRDKYSMMIANFRKAFPKNFMAKLEKAFPEFNIKYGKSELEESFVLNEEENPDKYKRWGIVFPTGVVGNDVIDNLDKNIIKFMKAVKAYFAVPIDYKGKKFSYSISYDEDKVKQYHNKFYGSKNENIVSKILGLLLEEDTDTEKGNINLELIFGDIDVKNIKQGEERVDDSFSQSMSSIMKKGSASLNLVDLLISDDSLNKISEEVKKKKLDSKEVASIGNILKGSNKGNKIQVKHDKALNKLDILLGVTQMGRNVWLNVPIKENGVEVKNTLKGLFKGVELNNCGIAYAKPKDPLVEKGLKVKVKIGE